MYKTLSQKSKTLVFVKKPKFDVVPEHNTMNLGKIQMLDVFFLN